MAIQVHKLENIFWTNGSWEKPNTIPEISEFTSFPKILVNWNDNKTVGVVILTGDWNYAYCEEQWYFLKRIRVADREGAWTYALLKDWWMNWIQNEVSFTGYCTKTSNKELLLNNIDYVEPVIKNPCKLYRLNLSDDISRHWYEDLEEIKQPSISPDFFTKATITTKDWWKFLKQIEQAPVDDGLVLDLKDNKEARYKKGVVVLGELEVQRVKSHWKEKVAKKLEAFYHKDNLNNYSLTKVTKLGESTVKNLYALTLSNKGIGEFEETARVSKLDFSGLFDIEILKGLSGAGEEIRAEFEGLEINKEILDREHTAEVTSEFLAKCRNFKVLQRKVYFPYLRKNWATNNDYLYRTHLDPSEISSARSQDTTALSGYAEADPLVPIYQGFFAQGLKSKSKSNEAFYLPWTYQLDTSLNYYITSSYTEQRQTNFNGKIEWFSEDNPPEFGLLIFGQYRERKNWTWWHYRGQKQNSIRVITGLKEGWEISNTSTYDRNANKWVDRVSKWWSNFQLLNSLYPYSWLYYFTAIRDNSVKISYRDWDEWGGTTGFFNTKVGKEGEINLAQLDIKTYTQRDIDNNVLDLAYFDKVREDFFQKKVITEEITTPLPITNQDIFFSDLTAFWEEYEQAPSSYKYATELGWYLDVKKNHRTLKKVYKSNKEAPKLVFYWNNNLKKYQLGIYYTYSYEHSLAKENNDILRVKFREDNSNTDRLKESAPDGVQSKTILYHHIKPIRNESTKQEVQDNKGTFQLQAFKDYCIAQNDAFLKQVDNLLSECGRFRAQGYVYDAPSFLREVGTPTGKFRDRLPKNGIKYDYEEIFKLLNVDDFWAEHSEHYKTSYYHYTISNYRSAVTGSFAWWSSTFGSEWGTRELYEKNDVDFLKFGDGSYVCIHSLEASQPVRQIREYLRLLKTTTKDISHFEGETHTFQTTREFIRRINDRSLQKDIYKQFNLLDSNNRIIQDDINIKNKLFALKGTGYELWIDNEEDAHLIFTPNKAKADILFEETKLFRLPHTEVPTQDYIDAINQQTAVQIATASYPLQERLLFKEQGSQLATIGEDEYAENSFKLNIHRFSVEGKQNLNDYYIIEYQGARQLLDVKLGIPKRTVKQSRDTDLVALEQLSFERERWREEIKNRQEIWEHQKQREFENFQFTRERLANETASAGVNLALGVVSGFGGAGVIGASGLMALNASKSAITASLSGTQTINGHTLDALESGYRSRQIATYGRAGLGFAGAVQNTFNAGMQLRELALQGRELDADIRQAIGIYTAQANQFQTEHIYNERNFALQLMKVGNVFQQGEVNDRDVTDQYNDKKGLKEVHLIYRVPSRVQKEGLERYYKLYGSNCQIPDVEFKFNKYLREGEIWQFGFIDSITNLWATEEKEVLKSVFANGIKILSLTKVIKPNLLPSVKPWATKIDELLSEASPEEKNVLFNKLTIGLDQPEIIKHLAEHTVDKNSLVPIITQFLDKESLLAKLAESDDKEHLTKFVLKLLDRIDQDELFNEILRHKDKEKLVEQWIEGGSQLMRTLWDKYPEHTVSRDEHTEIVSTKNKTIEEKDAQLQEDQKQITTLTRRIGDLNQKIDKASSKARIDNITILNQREQYSLQAQELLKEKTKSRQLATEKEEKERQVASVTKKLETAQSNFQKAEGNVQRLTAENKDKDRQIQQARIEKTDLIARAQEAEGKTKKVEQELETNKEELEKIKKEKETLTLQYDEQLKKLQDCESKPASKGEFVDTHKNVDYVIAKGEPDKIVVTTWNSEKNIWQEVPDLIVKANSTKKLLRLANKKEEYVTSQYPLWSYYRNNWGSEFGTSVNKYSELDGYVNNTNIKQSYAWLGRATVQLDNNLPYLSKEGNLAKPYYYHPIKGWFDYEYDGAEKVENFEKYQELTKNIVVEQQKTIEGLRQVEKFKEGTHADKRATKALLDFIYKLHFSSKHSLFIARKSDFNYSRVSLYYFDSTALIWCYQKQSSYEYKKLWTYRSKTPWAWRFTDEDYISDILRDEWINGYSTNWGSSNLNSKCTRNSDECGVDYALHIGNNDVITMSDDIFDCVPKVTIFPTNNNYKNLELSPAVWINDSGQFTNANFKSKNDKKLTTYLEYLDFLGLKWSEKKGKPVLKDEED